jgi:nickel/cobalt transporter (NicO) family protein
MYSILSGTILVSILHALIPSHWLPLLAISKNHKWSNATTLWITLYMGLAHVLSTILVGFVLSLIGTTLYDRYEHYFDLIAPIALVVLGILFIYRHYTHHHFHVKDSVDKPNQSKTKVVVTLIAIMFFSPCLEVEGYFLVASKYGFHNVLFIAIIYLLVSITGMLLWMWVALHGLKKLDWHKIEHNAGLITGLVLILSGIFSYLIH